MRKLFGTDGVRGIVGKELTPLFIARLALAIGSYFGEGSRILVGMDYRGGNEAIKKIVEGSLVFSGLKVYDAGLTPTPALQHAVKTQGFDGGVMITASHNPPEYSGIKVIGPHGIEIDRDEEKIIEEYFHEEKYRIVDWRNYSEDVQRYPLVNEIYINSVVSKVDVERISKRGFRVLVDPANNVGVLTTPKILRKLGAKPIVINGNLDTQPYRYPEPTPENLIDTARLVPFYRCDLGVAHDGDADRAIIIDEKGEVHWGDRTAVLLAKHLVLNRGEKGKIYTGVSSSTIIEEALKPLNTEVVWLKVGSVDIAHAMRKAGDALCGFEENGGFMYPPHQFVRDGGMTTALLLEYLATEARSISDLYSELPRYFTIKTKYKMSRDKASIIVEKVKEEFRNERLITIDGVKAVSRDYWVLVRPSGTEPLLRVMIEAKDEAVAKQLLERIDKFVKEAMNQ
ncbi:MAG: phosphoglucosamine mutase [Desulfurococcaceae archaeon]